MDRTGKSDNLPFTHFPADRSRAKRKLFHALRGASKRRDVPDFLIQNSHDLQS